MKNIIITAFTLVIMGIFSTVNLAFAGDRVNVFEMAESGQTFFFPMTREEIAAEDAENAKLAAIKKTKSEEQRKQVVIFELAESGEIIEFPAKAPDNFGFEAIAEKNASDDSKM